MVLAIQLGKPRSFWRGFGLTVASFTIYAFYWNHKAHDELYKQFELARERREQGTTWYILGFLLPFLRFVYYSYFVQNVMYLRQRIGLARTVTVGSHLGLTITGTALIYIGGLVGAALAAAGADLDNDAAFAGGIITLLVSLATWVTLYMIAYARLQRAINEVWASYAQRAWQLREAAKREAWPAPGSGRIPGSLPG